MIIRIQITTADNTISHILPETTFLKLAGGSDNFRKPDSACAGDTENGHLNL